MKIFIKKEYFLCQQQRIKSGRLFQKTTLPVPHPLNLIHPFVFMDCIHYKARENGKTLSRAAYRALELIGMDSENAWHSFVKYNYRYLFPGSAAVLSVRTEQITEGATFLQIPPHGRHPCSWLYPSHYQGGLGTFTH